MHLARTSLLTLSWTLLACGPPDDPGSNTEATTSTTSAGSSATTLDETPTTSLGETTVIATTDDGGTDSESGGELCGAPGQVRWIRQFDAATQTGLNAMSLAVDGAGNVILVGQLRQAASFGGETFVPVDEYPDAYVVKFDTEGNHVWSRHFGGWGEQRINTVAVDDDGTIALAGMFSGSIDLGGGPLVSASFMDGFVANLTADGEHVWSRSFTSSDKFSVCGRSDVAIADGATVWLADFRDRSDFGGGPIGLLGSHNGFAVKFDVTGAHVWSRAMGSGGLGSFETSAVAIDAAGDVWATGRFENEAVFGEGPPVSVSTSTVYVARWSADGEPVDVLLTTGQASTHAPYASALAADANGRVYVAGGFSGQLGFGGEPLMTTGALDGFVATLGGDGAPLWHKAVGQGAEVNQETYEIASNAAGRTAIAGSFAVGIDFGDGVSVAGKPGLDGYVAKLDVDGSALWARALGAETWAMAGEVAIDDAGAVYVAGEFRGNLTIDGHMLEMIDEYDTVLLKLCP
ncbi:hypothetical protein [Nannocystis radixulma]|uniref:Beta-propeller repeat protein n=1 Tax=Nannocystis radixulma TaxID=2995305 RepID=A0ABT5AX06_9BACT|nr:hypothetical protein [Nannocystis radixulma]MDC0666356.1 hypothetical protein [Nannocystis radixulma]